MAILTDIDSVCVWWVILLFNDFVAICDQIYRKSLLFFKFSAVISQRPYKYHTATNRIPYDRSLQLSVSVMCAFVARPPSGS